MRAYSPTPFKILKIISHYGEIAGLINLHKIVHTLQSKGLLELKYNFIKYSFGPYSKELEEDLNLLKSLGLIVIEERDGVPVIKLSRRGAEVVKSLKELKKA